VLTPQRVSVVDRRYAQAMPFDRPAPDLAKVIAAWEAWEKGEETPGRVLTNMKTAGLAEVFKELVATGWVPTVPTA